MAIHIQMSIKQNKLTIRLKGELDQSVTEKLKVRVTEIIDKYDIKFLVLNFEQLNFMDSSGIGFIIGRYTQLKKKSGKIYVCSMNDIIERIFLLSGLKKICSIAKNEEDVDRLMGVIA